jgi:hypothetical protein
MSTAEKTPDAPAKPANRRGRPPAQVEPKKWRVRGRSIDGTTVTLGRYDTEEEAANAREMRVKEGIFENLRVHAIKLDPELVEGEEGVQPGADANSDPKETPKPISDPQQTPKAKSDPEPKPKSTPEPKAVTKAASKTLAKAKTNVRSNPKAKTKAKSK